MEDYKKEIEEILKQSKDEIRQRTREVIKEKIIDSISWEIKDEISDIVEETIKTELGEEIRNTVIECKKEILEGIKPAFASIGAEIAKTMETKAIENLQSSWKSSEVIKDLFN